jgi:hypothetical protein
MARARLRKGKSFPLPRLPGPEIAWAIEIRGALDRNLARAPLGRTGSKAGPSLFEERVEENPQTGRARDGKNSGAPEASPFLLQPARKRVKGEG